MRPSTAASRLTLPVWRRNSPTSLALLVGLMALAYLVCAVGSAQADVNMRGRLEPSQSLASTMPGGIKPLATSANGTYRCADTYSVVGNWYYYFAIGNCPAGAELEVVSYASENTKTHEHSYGGFINGAFSGCGWIDTRYPVEKLNSNSHSACAGSGSSREFKVEESTFMEKYNHDLVGEGTPVGNPKPCPEYANYRPWSEGNVEKELIRTAPAYAASGPGSRYPAIKWRYVTKYASTDGTGKYVMVEDDRITGAEGNWVFVPLSCLRNKASELPENPGEQLPPPPTATTGGFSNVTTTSATLSGSVNPNGLETHYYIEWGREASKPYEAFAPTPYPGEDVGAGNETVNRSVAATGLKPGTLYYYRIVAQSPAGTGEGGLASFTTVAEPPEATTEAASEIKPLQAQFNGSVNPKGTPTTYYFKYGKTISYGSKTEPEGNAGSGQSAVGESSTAALEPGTTYHYRIVAHNEGGTVEGGDQEFKTPGPVEAVTSAASGVAEEQATLNGTVNPRGYDAKYYFQYGKTISYSSKTEPEGDAGAGPTPVLESAKLAGLLPGTTYYFRLVSTSGGVTSYGANQTFTTQYEPPDTRWVDYTVGTGETSVFYRNGSGALAWWQWHPKTGWEEGVLGGHVAAGTTPSVVYTPGDGETSVYYQETGGLIAYYQWQPGRGWVSGVLGKGHEAADSSPA
ncbi:MAG TPA: fibronectin type III domain-containing protein, partial [Solirubrobacteraceae bacterium]